MDKLASSEIERLRVEMLPNKIGEDEIIERLCGGDGTKGSCSSLAFAYAGNRAGYDVLDFRGGESRHFFSRYANIVNITEQVGGRVFYNFSDYESYRQALNVIEVGKEYYYATSRHAAIIRKLSDGSMEYLELQSGRSSGYTNGWHELTESVLKWRFKARKSHTSLGDKWKVGSELIEIGLLAQDRGFRRMLSYINTEPGKQRKGYAGTIK